MSEFKVPKRIKKAKKTINPAFAYGVIIAISAMLAGLVAFNVYLRSLPPIKNLDDFKPNVVTKFYSADGEVVKTFAAFTFSKSKLEDAPKNLVQAIIATEDKNFYNHHGYDLTGLVRSTVVNMAAMRAVQGASTITQQLARILFLSNEKTYTRKIKEFVIAARIEKTIDKDSILEMYLNNVYLGAGAYGIEAAAQIYFNKNPKDLTLSESALIAGLPQAPSVYSPYNSLDKAQKRRDQVLNRMYKMKFITKQELKDAKNAKIVLNSMPQLYATNKAPYFCDFAMKELAQMGFDEVDISQGGYKIITTLDYKTQVKTNEAILKNMNAWGLKGDKQQAAAFVYSPIDGRILAYAGGKDYSKSQYDRVYQAQRPPGSAFKPFIYAAAIEKGLDPNDMIDDTPFKAGNWSPKNYGSKYRGPIPVYTALMVSSNVCAARVIQYVGVRAVIQMARVLGISTPIEYDYTIALGSNAVKLFELTRAYGAFANGGYRVEPYAIERVESARGQILYQAPKTKISKVLDINTAAVMTAMMKTVLTSGTGTAASIGKPAAGKTGTTDDSKDSCFVGYTPDVVTGVWVGNDDNTRMGNLTGGTVPALIWKDIMTVATVPYGSNDFDYPEVKLMPFSLKRAPTEINKKEATAAIKQDELGVDFNELLPSDLTSKAKPASQIAPNQNTPATGTPAQAPAAAPRPPAMAPIPMATPIGTR